MIESELTIMLNSKRQFVENKIKTKSKELQAMQEKVFKPKKHIKTVSKQIQALEAQKNVLLTTITNLSEQTQGVVDKNNYTTYPQQVLKAYDMYESRAFNGAELFGAVTDMRVACIAGEGINFTTQNEKKKKYIENFIKKNKLQGSNLLNFVLTGELEGKNIIILEPKIIQATMPMQGKTEFDKDKSYVKAKQFLWIQNEYEVEYDENDKAEIKQIKYKQKKEDKNFTFVEPKKFTFVKIGGTDRYPNESTNGLHRSLTQFENFSRAGFDLRKTSHLHGSPKPIWSFDPKDPQVDKNIKALEKQLAAADYDIGEGQITTGDFKFASPDSSAVNIILKDMLENLRTISTNTNIPIHWLSYPELMSNRATAENISKSMEYGTKKARMLWEEGIKEMIEKSMIIAIDNGIADNDILEGDFEIKLPLIDLMQVIEMIKELYVLVKEKFLPTSYLYNRLPGTDPEKIKEALQEEAEKEKEVNDEKIKNETKLRLDMVKNKLDNNHNSDDNKEVMEEEI
jgi:hypothetical protein